MSGRMGLRARRLPTALLVVTAATAAEPHPAFAQLPQGVAELQWLSGSWIAEAGPGQELEEWWSPPRGNSLVGAFRWIRDGELWMTEHLSISEEDGELWFRLRHFSADMTPWEAAGDGFVYRLEDGGPGRAVFGIATPQPGRPLRFVFRADPPDSLVVRLEGESDGQPTVQEFRFRRQADGGMAPRPALEDGAAYPLSLR